MFSCSGCGSVDSQVQQVRPVSFVRGKAGECKGRGTVA